MRSPRNRVKDGHSDQGNAVVEGSLEHRLGAARHDDQSSRLSGRHDRAAVNIGTVPAALSFRTAARKSSSFTMS